MPIKTVKKIHLNTDTVQKMSIQTKIVWEADKESMCACLRIFFIMQCLYFIIVACLIQVQYVYYSVWTISRLTNHAFKYQIFIFKLYFIITNR